VYQIDKIEIQKYYEDKLLNKYSFNSEEEKKIIIDFVENLPIRTQIQLLLALKEDNAEKVKSVFNVFWNNWNEWNSNNSIIFDQPEVFPLVVIRFLLANDLIENGHSLLPNNSNFSISASLFVAGFYYQSLTAKSPSFIFDYLLRIGLAHEVSEVLYSTSSLNKKEDFESFVDHCKIKSTTKLRTISGRYNSISITSSKDKERLIFEPVGCVEIYALYKSSKEEKNKRIDSILKDSGIEVFTTVGLLPVSVTRDNRGVSTTVYSIFNLLGLIGDLFKNKTGDLNDIIRFLRASSDIISYPKLGGIETPEKVNKDQDLGVEDDALLESSKADDPEFEQFAKSLSAWMKESETNDWLIPSTYLLSNIMSRFYDNLKSIKSDSFAYVGDWMSFVVSIFLNSVIIEEHYWNMSLESKYKIRHSKLYNSNRYFLDNLRVVQTNKKNFGFSVWLMRCPLLNVFIDVKEIKSKLLTEEFEKLLGVEPFVNMFETLKKVPTKAEKSTSNSESLDEDLVSDETVQKITEYCRKNRITVPDIDNMSNTKFRSRILKPALNLKRSGSITVYDKLRISVKAGL